LPLLPAERKADASRGTTFAFNTVALWLLLVAPFVVFLGRHQYSLLNPEIALCLGIAAALALVVAGMAQRPGLRVLALSLAAGLAVDAQFDQFGAREIAGAAVLVAGLGWVLRDHLARIVAVTGLAFLTSTLLLERTPQPTEALLAGGNDKRPFVLHVVLDEHIGLTGLPHGAKYDASLERLKSFFDRRGFQRFTDAYSEYFWTRYIFSQMLNFSNGRYTPGLFRVGRNARFELVENRYFSRVAKQGYSINVFQTTYLDVCPDPRTVAHCESYDYAGIRELQYSQLDWKDRLHAVSAAYVTRYFFYDPLRRAGRFLRDNANRQWLAGWVANSIRALPSFLSAPPSEHYAPVATRVLIDRLIAAVSGARRGQYVFAHLMLPHNPYVFRPDCSFRPPSEWNDRTDPDAPPRRFNTPEGREVRYVQYLDQVECLYKDLDRLLDAIPTELQQDAVVIVQGDHGSRINIVAPDPERARPLTATDLRDAYSTLFAVRSPAVPAGEDERRVAIGCMLTALVESEFTSASPNPLCNAEHTVFEVPWQPEVIAATAVAATYPP